MKKYRVILMVPQDKIVEANNTQQAHNYVTSMLMKSNGPYPHPALHSIEELEELEIEFTADFCIP